MVTNAMIIIKLFQFKKLPRGGSYLKTITWVVIIMQYTLIIIQKMFGNIYLNIMHSGFIFYNENK